MTLTELRFLVARNKGPAILALIVLILSAAAIVFALIPTEQDRKKAELMNKGIPKEFTDTRATNTTTYLAKEPEKKVTETNKVSATVVVKENPTLQPTLATATTIARTLDDSGDPEELSRQLSEQPVDQSPKKLIWKDWRIKNADSQPVQPVNPVELANYPTLSTNEKTTILAIDVSGPVPKTNHLPVSVLKDLEKHFGKVVGQISDK